MTFDFFGIFGRMLKGHELPVPSPFEPAEKTCPTCCGAGVVMSSAFREWQDLCPTCNSDGVVPIKEK